MRLRIRIPDRIQRIEDRDGCADEPKLTGSQKILNERSALLKFRIVQLNSVSSEIVPGLLDRFTTLENTPKYLLIERRQRCDCTERLFSTEPGTQPVQAEIPDNCPQPG